MENSRGTPKLVLLGYPSFLKHRDLTLGISAIILGSVFVAASVLPTALAALVPLIGGTLLKIHVTTMGRFELHVFDQGLAMGDRRTATFRWFPRGDVRVEPAGFRRVVLHTTDQRLTVPAVWERWGNRRFPTEEAEMQALRFEQDGRIMGRENHVSLKPGPGGSGVVIQEFINTARLRFRAGFGLDPSERGKVVTLWKSH